MSFMRRFQKQIFGSLIASTVGIVAVGVFLLWPQFQVFSLIRQLHSPDVDIRRLAAERLGEFGPVAAESVPTLTMALEDEDSLMRFNAAMSLCSIEPTSDVAAPVLLDFLRHFKPFDGFGGCRGPTVMEQVADALKGMGLKTIPHLTNALCDDCRNVRFWACFFYGDLGADTEAHAEP